MFDFDVINVKFKYKGLKNGLKLVIYIKKKKHNDLQKPVFKRIK